MRNLKTLIKTSPYYTVVLILLLFSSCQKNEQVDEKRVAMVGDSILTEEMVNSFIETNNKDSKFRDEYIKNWIELELLSQVSKNKELLTNENYSRIIKRSEKELAATIAKQNYLSLNPIMINDKDLKNFYKLNRDDYSTSEIMYLLNIVTFNDQAGAIKFRNNALKDGWENSITYLTDTDSLLNSNFSELFTLSEIQSKRITRVLKKLRIGEISLVIQTELNNFVIVQLNDIVQNNETPKFEYIKDQVYESYLVLKQREIIRNYIDSLFSHSQIKIY